MFHLALIHPQIPPNTGNIIRLAANGGSILHLVEPLGFSLSEKQLRRSSLDYKDLTELKVHANFEKLLEHWQSEVKVANQQAQLYFFSTKGKQYYHQARFKSGDLLIFGSETKGIDEILLKQYQSQVYKIPMQPNNRSLNLSNSVAIVLYEALRQNNFSNF